MGALASVLPMISEAFNVISLFKGTAQAAKNSAIVQDAAAVIGALAPLVSQFTGGKEVTEDDVRAALAGKDAALKAFDDLIAAKGG